MKSKENKFESFLNRVYYAFYSFNYYVGRMMQIFVDWTFGRLFYSFPFVRKRIEKLYGITSFEEYCRFTNDTAFNIVGKSTSPFVSYFMSCLSILLFSLPIFILVNLWLLFGGMPAWHIFGKGLFFFVLLGTVPSLLLCKSLVWKNDRYLKYFKKFEKESRTRKILWAVGVMLALVLLIVANFALMGLADEIHGFHPKQ